MSEPRSAPAGLDEHLGRWVEAGLITDTQAGAIRRHEEGGPPAPRLPLPAEAVADVGIVLGVAAAAVLWSRLEGHGDDGPRLVLSVGVTVALLVGGAILRRSDEAGFRRIASTLWLLGALAVGIVVTDAYTASARGPGLPSVTTLGAGVPMLVVGWITHALDRRTPTMVGAFAGTVTTGVGLVMWFIDDTTDDARLAAVAGILAAVGGIWLTLALAGRLRPPDRAGVLGAGALLVAPMFLVDQIPGMALLIGVTLSAGVMGTGVQLAGSATLVAGAIGLFGYLTGTLIHFFEDSLGVPLVLLIAAVVMIALAAAVVRLRRPGAPPTGS